MSFVTLIFGTLVSQSLERFLAGFHSTPPKSLWLSELEGHFR